MTQNDRPGTAAGSEIAVAVDEIRAATVFLTRLPPHLIGASTSRIPSFRSGARVFPVIGALVGLAGGAVLVVAMLLGAAAYVAAALAVATTAIITGGLHEDGLADTADSFGGQSTEQKLAIMDDSRVGTFGALAIVLSVAIRVAALGALAATAPLMAALALIAGEAVSRAALVRLWHDLPAARPGGLANDTGTPDQSAMLLAIGIAAVIAIVFGLPTLGLWATLLAGFLAAAGTWITVRITANALGGRTGDTLGACQQIALAAFLVGASAAAA